MYFLLNWFANGKSHTTIKTYLMPIQAVCEYVRLRIPHMLQFIHFIHVCAQFEIFIWIWFQFTTKDDTCLLKWKKQTAFLQRWGLSIKRWQLTQSEPYTSTYKGRTYKSTNILINNGLVNILSDIFFFTKCICVIIIVLGLALLWTDEIINNI